MNDRDRIEMLRWELRRAAYKLDEASGYIGVADSVYADTFALAAQLAREAITDYAPNPKKTLA